MAPMTQTIALQSSLQWTSDQVRACQPAPPRLASRASRLAQARTSLLYCDTRDLRNLVILVISSFHRVTPCTTDKLLTRLHHAKGKIMHTMLI